MGSPGGSSILVYNAKTAVGTLAWGLPMQSAIDLPNIVARGSRTSAESDRLTSRIREELTALGLVLTLVEGEDSGLHGIQWPGARRLDGGADPRRDGVWRVIRRR